MEVEVGGLSVSRRCSISEPVSMDWYGGVAGDPDDDGAGPRKLNSCSINGYNRTSIVQYIICDSAQVSDGNQSGTGKKSFGIAARNSVRICACTSCRSRDGIPSLACMSMHVLCSFSSRATHACRRRSPDLRELTGPPCSCSMRWSTCSKSPESSTNMLRNSSMGSGWNTLLGKPFGGIGML